MVSNSACEWDGTASNWDLLLGGTWFQFLQDILSKLQLCLINMLQCLPQEISLAPAASACLSNSPPPEIIINIMGGNFH